MAAERKALPVKLCGKSTLAFMLGFLVGSGAMCPKCGHGTSVTSKRWARCKKCGTKVPRQTLTRKGVSR